MAPPVYSDAKLKRYAKAQQRWSAPIATPLRRLHAWASLLFADHGFLRPLYWNHARVEDALWRGPQPNPFHIKTLAARGLKTIINLRGPTIYGSYALEREAAQRLGVEVHDVRLYSGGAPLKEHIHGLHDAFRKMQTPALLHCKSGADRAGLAAALYLILMKDVPVAQAMRQLSWRFGHIKASKTGILDAFFERYLADTALKPMAFLSWLDEVYDPKTLESAFAAAYAKRRWIDVIVRRE